MLGAGGNPMGTSQRVSRGFHRLGLLLIGELKLSFSLDLVLQAVHRTAACHKVWLALGPAGAQTPA